MFGLWPGGGPSAADGPAIDVAALEAMVAHQQYAAALEALNRSAATPSARLAWLRAQAEAGHVPLQYELAALLFPDEREESLKWYARGRLARTLDGAECKSASSSLMARVVLDNRASAVRDAGVADAKAFQAAIEDALAWDAARSTYPSASWICGTGAEDLKPDPQRLAARAAARHAMQIAAKAVTDFQRAVEAGKAADFKIVDAGVFALPSFRRWIGWLDNRRVLFIGLSKDRPPESRPVYTVWLWDVEANQAEAIAAEPRAIDELCVYANNVSYRARGLNERKQELYWVVSGTFPNLVKREVLPGEGGFSSRQLDCEPPRTSPSGLRWDQMHWLNGGEGYVFDGPRTPLNPDPRAIFHRADGVEISLPVGNTGGRILAYAPWKQSYLLSGAWREPGATSFRAFNRRERGDDDVLVWLTPAGTIDVAIIPDGVWSPSTASSSYGATKLGLILQGGFPDNEREPGYAGLYLFRDEPQVTRLSPGYGHLGAVSPDGCRIAFSRVDSMRPGGSGEKMQMIDVCLEN